MQDRCWIKRITSCTVMGCILYKLGGGCSFNSITLLYILFYGFVFNTVNCFTALMFNKQFLIGTEMLNVQS